MKFLRNKEMQVVVGFSILVAFTVAMIGFKISIQAGLLILASNILLVCVSILSYRVLYKKVDKLSDTVDMILHSDEVILFGETEEEGDFAVLESEIRKMTVKLRESAYLLQKEKIYLTDSIADISHQLRTPLTTINLLMSFLQKHDLTVEERFKYVNEINSHLRRVDWLISSLLKISKIDAETVVMKKEKVSVAKVVAKAAEAVMIPLEIRNQLFEYKSMGNEHFIGDFNWTVEALSNIIKNCMEHTPEGGEISVYAKETILYTKIVVEDSGSGISKEDLPHLFERFYKGKGSSDSSVGIGLALSRMIIQTQNGSIKAENRKEGGSRFIIKFYKGVS